MAYIGAFPTARPLGTADIEDGSIQVADLASTLDLSSKTVTLPSGTGGKVLQYQSAQITTNLSTTSTSYVDATGLSVSITPASTSNKILILFTGTVGNNGNTSNTFVTCLRGTTNLASDTNDYFFFNSAGTRIYAGASLHFIDEPSTTSATTYKIQYKVDGSSTGYIQDKARITLMELSA